MRIPGSQTHAPSGEGTPLREQSTSPPPLQPHKLKLPGKFKSKKSEGCPLEIKKNIVDAEIFFNIPFSVSGYREYREKVITKV